MVAVPKPTPQIRGRKRLTSRPHRIADRIRAATFAMWGETCLWCEQPGGALDLHHVQRRSQGGKDEPLNLRPLHRKCHSFVHDHPTEAKRRGFLA